MESSDRTPDEETKPVLIHYTTGNLTDSQAATLNRWRDRLAEDRPLPGARHKGGLLREFFNLDDRPPCSLSDVIATAVIRYMRRPPEPLDVARYAHASRQAQIDIGRFGARENSPVHKKVSFYLPEDVATRWENLRKATGPAVVEFVKALRAQVEEEFPGPERQRERGMAFWMRLTASGLPEHPPRIPGGVIARMAIDKHARRDVEKMILEAAVYAEEVHVQPHRTRRDVHGRNETVTRGPRRRRRR
ncbi:hypothetical protein [Nonomuraea candida]|uniref:hypothetical protein n=1 Tax=Nonomuraea candida TaxID=359159 RepID=UPI0005B842F6|nr:hypothetical protein [Nonomuraea candida]